MKYFKNFVNFSEKYNPKSTDIGFLLELSENNKIELVHFAIATLEKINSAIDRCDKKAISIITIVISLSGALYLLMKENGSELIVIKIIYTANLLLVFVSVGLSLSSLVVRAHKIPPTVGNIVQWVKCESKDMANDRLLATLILAMSSAEDSYIHLLERKANLLIWAQLIGFLSITCIFVSMVLVKIYFV